MALVGTISGSNGTSNTAVTGTLVIANVSSGFPSIPSDSIFFVSGSTVGGTTRSVVGGDLVTSGTAIFQLDVQLSGSLRVQKTNTTPTFGSNEGVFFVSSSNAISRAFVNTVGSTPRLIGYAPAITTITGTFSASSDSFLVVKPSTSTVTINLPSASIDDMIIVKHGNSSSYNVNIIASGTDTVDGYSSYLITTRQCLTLSYENGTWHIR